LSTIRQCELPEGALLRKYQLDGAFADCYVTEVASRICHARYVEAFYTTALFKLERLVLAWLASRPSTDAEAGQLASGSLDTFAAWNVEARSENQLLLSDFQGRTRSWLMVAHAAAGGEDGTMLYFGSAVLPARGASSASRELGGVFRLLLGFHKVYSRALLLAARSRLTNMLETLP